MHASSGVSSAIEDGVAVAAAENEFSSYKKESFKILNTIGTWFGCDESGYRTVCCLPVLIVSLSVSAPLAPFSSSLSTFAFQ